MAVFATILALGGPPPAPTEYSATVEPLAPGIQAVMRGVSWKPGCPVPLDKLRSVRLVHRTYGGASAWGTLIVHQDVADDVVEAFRQAWKGGFRIESVVPVFVYGGSDLRSVEANNTSAFNCRPVTGRSKGWSKHAWGRAIDINPRVNPYWVKRTDKVIPESGRRYINRFQRTPGLIRQGDSLHSAFRQLGWTWGGDWRKVKDWQHFEKKPGR